METLKLQIENERHTQEQLLKELRNSIVDDGMKGPGVGIGPVAQKQHNSSSHNFFKK
jgi:hypothetical protein